LGKIISLVGSVGSGKSAQAQLLAERHGWHLLPTGQLLRTKHPDLTADLSAGNLVDSEAVKAIWDEKITAVPADQDIIMDSFPRKMEEAEWFLDKLAGWGRELVGIFELDVPEQVAVERLLARGRMDDSEKSLRHRLWLYHEDTRPVFNYCQKLGYLTHVDGVGDLEAVYRRVDKAIIKRMEKSMPKVVVLIGPPGAGKSVQAEMLSRVDGWRHISTGDLLRKRRPDLMERMLTGELIDSKEVQDTLTAAVSEMPPDQSIILDGFPRTAAQAEWLDGQMAAWGRQFGGLVELYVGAEETVSRLSLRGRQDDDLNTVKRRLELYEAENMPLISYYKSKGNLHRIDGVGTVEAVHGRIKEALS